MLSPAFLGRCASYNIPQQHNHDIKQSPLLVPNMFLLSVQQQYIGDLHHTPVVHTHGQERCALKITLLFVTKMAIFIYL